MRHDFPCLLRLKEASPGAALPQEQLLPEGSSPGVHSPQMRNGG